MVIFYLTILCHFLQITGMMSNETTCPQLKLPNGRIKIRYSGRIAKFRCFKPYVLVGDNIATCIHGDWNIQLPFCAMAGCRKMEKIQHGDLIVGYRGAIITPICELGFRLIGSPLIYCRGQTWNDTSPVCLAENIDQFEECKFEDDGEKPCEWIVKPSIFSWKLSSSILSGKAIDGSTTHPLFDHTLGPHTGGHYLYLEANYPASLWSLKQVQLSGGAAHYISPLYPPLLDEEPSTCLIFWYYIYGPYAGMIKVNVANDTVWEKNGSVSNKWQKALILLRHQPTPFHIIIDGIGSLGHYSNTAIDDLKVVSGSECHGPSEEALEYPVEPIDVFGKGATTSGTAVVNYSIASVVEKESYEATTITDISLRTTEVSSYTTFAKTSGSVIPVSSESNFTTESAFASVTNTIETCTNSTISDSEDFKTSTLKVIGTIPSTIATIPISTLQNNGSLSSAHSDIYLESTSFSASSVTFNNVSPFISEHLNSSSAVLNTTLVNDSEFVTYATTVHINGSSVTEPQVIVSETEMSDRIDISTLIRTFKPVSDHTTKFVNYTDNATARTVNDINDSDINNDSSNENNEEKDDFPFDKKQGFPNKTSGSHDNTSICVQNKSVTCKIFSGFFKKSTIMDHMTHLSNTVTDYFLPTFSTGQPTFSTERTSWSKNMAHVSSVIHNIGEISTTSDSFITVDGVNKKSTGNDSQINKKIEWKNKNKYYLYKSNPNTTNKYSFSFIDNPIKIQYSKCNSTTNCTTDKTKIVSLLNVTLYATNGNIIKTTVFSDDILDTSTIKTYHPQTTFFKENEKDVSVEHYNGLAGSITIFYISIVMVIISLVIISIVIFVKNRRERQIDGKDECSIKFFANDDNDSRLSLSSSSSRISDCVELKNI